MEDCLDMDKKGKTKMNMKRVVLWGVIAILAIAVIYTLFFNQSSSSNISPVVQAAAQTASSGMVGGC